MKIKKKHIFTIVIILIAIIIVAVVYPFPIIEVKNINRNITPNSIAKINDDYYFYQNEGIYCRHEDGSKEKIFSCSGRPMIAVWSDELYLYFNGLNNDNLIVLDIDGNILNKSTILSDMMSFTVVDDVLFFLRNGEYEVISYDIKNNFEETVHKPLDVFMYNIVYESNSYVLIHGYYYFAAISKETGYSMFFYSCNGNPPRQTHENICEVKYL